MLGDSEGCPEGVSECMPDGETVRCKLGSSEWNILGKEECCSDGVPECLSTEGEVLDCKLGLLEELGISDALGVEALGTDMSSSSSWSESMESLLSKIVGLWTKLGSNGSSEGRAVGCKLGSSDGGLLGCKLGSSDGGLLGCKLGSSDGRLLGCKLGWSECKMLGDSEGCPEGVSECILGSSDRRLLF